MSRFVTIIRLLFHLLQDKSISNGRSSLSVTILNFLRPISVSHYMGFLHFTTKSFSILSYVETLRRKFVSGLVDTRVTKNTGKGRYCSRLEVVN